MSNKILKFFKFAAFFILLLILTLFLALSVFNNKEFAIKTSSIQKIVDHFDHDLIVDPINAQIKIKNYKIIISIDQLKLHKNNNKDIIFNNINATIHPFILKSNITLQIANMPLHHFVQLHENQKTNLFIDHFFNHNHIVCSGSIDIELSLLTPKNIELNINSNDGWHDPKKDNLKKLQLKEFDFSLHYHNDKVSITKFYLSYIDGFDASLTGSFSFAGDEFLLADFQTDLNMLQVDYLAGIWHPEIYKDVQYWVTNHIKNGTVTQAHGIFNFTNDDLESSSLRKEAIEVQMKLADIEVNYLPNYSPITKVNGDLKIDGQGLYLNNATGLIDNNKLKNIKLDLPFKSLILSLNTDVEGDIYSFNQFIPAEITKKLASLAIDFSTIKGQASANVILEIPILEQFQPHNMILNINSSLKNVVLGNKGILKFDDANLVISNNKMGIKFELFSKDTIFIEYGSPYPIDNSNTDRTYFNAEITTKNGFSLSDAISIKGNFKTKFVQNNKNWQFNLNLDKAEVDLSSFAYNKAKEFPLTIDCSGEFEKNQIIVNSCNMLGKDLSGKVKLTYLKDKNIISEIVLENFKLGRNDFSLNVSYRDNTFYTKLNANYLDLSNFSLSNFSSNSKNKFSYDIDIKIKQLNATKNNELQNIKARIIQRNNKPIDIDLKAFSNDKVLTITKIKNSNQTGHLLYTNDAATFAQDFGIYENIKKGELWLEVFPKNNKNAISYYGSLKLNKFAFTNTSALTKIILGITSVLNSPEAFLNSLKGGSLQSDSFEADLIYNQGTLSVNNGEIKGPSYEVKLNGYIDFDNSKLDFRGVYIPSVMGLNKLISDLPIIGTLLSGGKDSALIGANFSITGTTKNPDIFFNPLSILTPGFLRNLF